MMMKFTVETRDQIAAALVAHGEDARVLALLGRRIKKVEMPRPLAGLVGVWPADADGVCRISLSDVQGLLVWRSMALFDMATGRGLEAHLARRLGVGVEDAYDYFRKVAYARARHMVAYDHEKRSHTARRWTEVVKFIVDGRTFPVRYGCQQPDLDTDYGILLDLGLVLPLVDGDGGAIARPSSLFLTPTPDSEPLNRADDEALSNLALA